MEERPIHDEISSARDGVWLPAAAIASLRDLTARYLDGERVVDDSVDRVAKAFATAAHDSAQPPERLLIAVRAVWRDFGFSQSDRLQLASLYDRLIRSAINRYYDD